MDLNYSYKLSHEQKFQLTNDMKQSIKILEMPLFELRNYIDESFEKNPILEIEDRKVEEDSFKNYDEECSPFNFISEEKTLKEYLYEQIMYMNISNNKIYKVIKYIIENIDSRGYLLVPYKKIEEELNIEPMEMNEAINTIKELEPYGIGSETLEDCLKNQLVHLGYKDKALFDIVEKYLEELSNNEINLISKELSISKIQVQKYGDVIKSLNPKPTSGFYTGDKAQYIVPDAEIIEKDGQLLVVLNNEFLPNLVINDTYKVIKKGVNNSTNTYINKKISEGTVIIKSIEERKKTLKRVLEVIVTLQEDYFKKGINYLKPMMLKDIAKELMLHESTISRAIKDKYILTNFGTIEIKKLFQGNVYFNKNEISSINIKNRIKELIKGENKKKPISDEVISKCLLEYGLNVSRRTVAKYREEIGIKSSSKRRRV